LGRFWWTAVFIEGLGGLVIVLNESVVRREVGDKLNQGFVLNNLAQVLFLDGDLAGARKMHESALALDRENANQVATAEALFDLGQVLAAQGNLAGARKSLEEALKIWTGIGEADSANSARLALAQLSLEDGHLQDAENSARKLSAEASSKKQGELAAQSQIVVAQALLSQNKLPEATAAATLAQSWAAEIGDLESQLSFKISAARVQGLAGPADARLQAMQTLQQCLDQAAKGGFLAQQMEAELALGELEIASGKPDAGRARLQSLQKQAAPRGYLLLAHQAATARFQQSASK